MEPHELQPLLITARQAAVALAISEKTLWTWTQREDIPCVRIGRSVRYSVEDLRVWIKNHSSTDKPLDQ